MLYQVLGKLHEEGYTVTLEPSNRQWRVTLSNERRDEQVSALATKLFHAITDCMAQLEDEDLQDYAGDLGRARGEVSSNAKSEANKENGRKGGLARWAKK